MSGTLESPQSLDSPSDGARSDASRIVPPVQVPLAQQVAERLEQVAQNVEAAIHESTLLSLRETKPFEPAAFDQVPGQIVKPTDPARSWPAWEPAIQDLVEVPDAKTPEGQADAATCGESTSASSLAAGRVPDEHSSMGSDAARVTAETASPTSHGCRPDVSTEPMPRLAQSAIESTARPHDVAVDAAAVEIDALAAVGINCPLESNDPWLSPNSANAGSFSAQTFEVGVIYPATDSQQIAIPIWDGAAMTVETSWIPATRDGSQGLGPSSRRSQRAITPEGSRDAACDSLADGLLAEQCAALVDTILHQVSSGASQSIAFLNAEPRDTTHEFLLPLAVILARRELGEVLLVVRRPLEMQWLRLLADDRPMVDDARTAAADQMLSAIRATRCKGLSLLHLTLPTASRPANAKAQLGSWRKLHQRFRFVLLDASGESVEAPQALSITCDGVYLCVQLGHTGRATARRTADLVEKRGGRLLGCIVVGREQIPR